MRKPWNVNWVRRGDITGGFALMMTAVLFTLYILVVAAGYLIAGIFLLVRWLIRRHRAKRQVAPVGLPAAPQGNGRPGKVGRIARTTVKFLEEEADVAYRPDWITPQMWDLAGKVTDAADEICARFVSRLVVDWDVTKAGQPYPLDVESVRALPAVFVKTVFAQLLLDADRRERLALTGPAHSKSR